VAAAELAAVVFGLAYVVLAIRQHRACWIAGGISTAIYSAVFLTAGLPLQAGLQVVYVAMSVYGWMAWRPGAGQPLRPRSWPWSRHLIAVAAVGIATALAAPLLATYAQSEAPYADALGTFSSIVATWLLARRYLGTWYWWIVIDCGLAALFASQGLRPTAALYLTYALLAIAGLRAWQRSLAAAS